ncbi:MAG: hypothetical protein GFH27_549367n22 [Chloroflexi bacterium AL-W]|nr:hypothetical protein [Chloroflexi bacterium AL-W]
MNIKVNRADAYAVLALAIVWLVFFWRIFTPNINDQATFIEGDYFGQFVTFGAYQYQRLSTGEIPLWNPYNNGGLPFLADTQSAALYPPRLLTIALTNLTGGAWTYSTLQNEVAFHLLFYTLVLYAFLRRLLRHMHGGHPAAFAGAVTAGYGGLMISYPLVQVALLEAAVWIPLVLLGILEATRHERIRWSWLAFGGLGLGLSWMAGHPQTAWFATYLAIAYVVWRMWPRPDRWRMSVLGIGLLGVVTLGVTAVHFLPGLEYLSLTMRTGLGFDEKAGGFLFQDVTMMLYPRLTWSPLYMGVVGLGLAVLGALRTGRERWFWIGALGTGLVLSLGGNSAMYHALYNVVPGLSFFRGQERAVLIVVNAVAVLVAFGVIRLHEEFTISQNADVQRGWRLYAAFVAVVAAGVFLLSATMPDFNGALLEQAFITAFFVLVASGLVVRFLQTKHTIIIVLLVALVAFELLTVNIRTDVIEPIPVARRGVMRPMPVVNHVLNDDELAFRVDGGIVHGFIGIPPGGNTGSLFGVRDMRGISPLFLDGAHAIIQRESPVQVAWEVFAVKYVFSEFPSLAVPSRIVAENMFLQMPLYLHQLENPRPFVHLVYDYEVITGDAFARQLLADARFDSREVIILADDPMLEVSGQRPDEAQAILTEYTPEQFSITASTAEAAILSVAHVDYPGWQVTLNGQSVTPIRAYGAVVGVPLPAGEHVIVFRYIPLSFWVGAGLSLVTWAGLAILGLWQIFKHRRL